jgi:hypothetical protein
MKLDEIIGCFQGHAAGVTADPNVCKRGHANTPFPFPSTLMAGDGKHS